jgi:hypothetical protein
MPDILSSLVGMMSPREGRRSVAMPSTGFSEAGAIAFMKYQSSAMKSEAQAAVARLSRWLRWRMHW